MFLKNLIKGCVVFGVVLLILALGLLAGKAFGQDKPINGCEYVVLACSPNQGSVVTIGTKASFTISVVKGGPCSALEYQVIDPNNVKSPLSTPDFPVQLVGKYTFQAKGKNQWGWGSWTTCYVTGENPNHNPNAKCKLVSMSSPFAPSTVEVSAIGSSDPEDGTSIEVMIIFDDPSNPETFYNWNAQHTFTTPGDKVIIVRVRDRDGNTDETSSCSVSLKSEPVYCYSDYEDELAYFRITNLRWYVENGKTYRDVRADWGEKTPPRGKKWTGFWVLYGNGYYEPETKEAGKGAVHDNPNRPNLIKELYREAAGKGTYSAIIKKVPNNSDRNFMVEADCGCRNGQARNEHYGSPETYTDRPPQKK